MSEEIAANKAVVRQFFEHFNAGRVDEAFQLVHPQVKWWVPEGLPFSGTKDRAQYLQIVQQIRRGFPTGFSITPTTALAEGNRVAVEASSSGTHVNGKSYNNRYHFLFEVDQGQIVGVKEYMNTLHLAQLIGAV